MADAAPRFTPGQQRVLDVFMRNGSSNRAIAQRLDIKEKTVKAHMTAIMAELGATTRVQVALKLLRPTKPGGADA